MADSFDLAAVRREFPVVRRMLYLDAAHQTPLAASVRAALESFYDESARIRRAEAMLAEADRRGAARIAKLIGAEPSEIAFTKNTSEGLNIAANAIPFTARRQCVDDRRRPSEQRLCVPQSPPQGRGGSFPSPDGRNRQCRDFCRPYRRGTRAISISHVTFHAGHRFDVEGIGKLARAKGIYLVVDAMQSVGVLPINVRQAAPRSLRSAATRAFTSRKAWACSTSARA